MLSESMLEMSESMLVLSTAVASTKDGVTNTIQKLHFVNAGEIIMYMSLFSLSFHTKI